MDCFIKSIFCDGGDGAGERIADEELRIPIKLKRKGRLFPNISL